MTALTVLIEAYSTGEPNPPGIVVDQWEGQVHLDARSIDDGHPSLTPTDARTLGAVLIAQADEAER